jgi:hypothetical protein
MAWAAGANDVVGGRARPLAGPVATVYQILASELLPLDERD